MDDKLFKSFINKVDKIFTFKETVPSLLPPPPLLPPLLLLLLSLSSFSDYKLELKLKPLLAIYVRFLLHLPT